MQTQIRKIGNSKGVIIPSAFLTEAGFKDTVDISVKNQQVIIAPVPENGKNLRADWAKKIDAILVGGVADKAIDKEWLDADLVDDDSVWQ